MRDASLKEPTTSPEIRLPGTRNRPRAQPGCPPRPHARRVHRFHHHGEEAHGHSRPQQPGSFGGVSDLVQPGGLLSAASEILENGCADGGCPDVRRGGIFFIRSTYYGVFSTVTNHSASNGAGVFADSFPSTVRAAACGEQRWRSKLQPFGPGSTSNALGANLSTDLSGSGFTSTASRNLGSFANNRRPTQTHSLLAGSAEIHRVPLGPWTSLSRTPFT